MSLAVPPETHVRASWRFGVTEGRPLVVVSRVGPDEFFTKGADLAAESLVEDTPPRPITLLLFGLECGFTDRQLWVIGHEVSHVVARLLRLPHDPTHDDGEAPAHA